MSQIIDLRNYTPNKTETFFFDTNIWMYLYCPLGNYRKAVIKIYDQFLKRVIQAKATILISSLILSEFFNAYLRLEFNILKNKNPAKYTDFKRDFRGKQEYRLLMATIVSTVKSQILKLAKRVDDEFAHLNLDDLFAEIAKSDFNDCYYAVLSDQKSFSIVTDDKDFNLKKPNLRVLTANRNLLRRP